MARHRSDEPNHGIEPHSVRVDLILRCYSLRERRHRAPLPHTYSMCGHPSMLKLSRSLQLHGKWPPEARRPFLSRIRCIPCSPGDAIVPFGVGFLVTNRFSAVSTRTMSGLDGPIGATSWFSTTDGRAQEFYSLLSSVCHGTSPR